MKTLTKIKEWFKSLFRTADELKDKYLPIAVNVVEAIKKAIESGTVDVIEDIAIMLYPKGGILIKKATEYAKDHIPSLCLQLQIIELSDLADGDVDALTVSLDKLKETTGEQWDNFMSGMAGTLVSYLSDGKIDWKEAKELAGEFYDEYVKQAKRV